MIFQVERLKKLPLQSQMRWQGGIFRMPAWVPNEEQKLYRPWTSLWANISTHKISKPGIEPFEHKNVTIALDSLIKFACDKELAGYRPGKIEVKDAALAEYLQEQLADTGITIVCSDCLLGFDKIFADLAKHMHGGVLLPDALSAKRVTMDMMRSFADAAAQFYAAKPWRYLCDADLVMIESPFVDPLLRYASILGNGGMTYGIAFYDSAKLFEQFTEGKGMDLIKNRLYWTLFFGGIEELPFGDADLWEDYNLPVASTQAYPLAMRFEPNGKHYRPQPDILAFMEGLLRAFAITSESELDSGKWQKKVSTFRGDETFTLALPGLLEPVQKPKSETGGIPARRAMEKIQIDIQRIIEGRDFSSPEQMQEFLNTNLVGKLIPPQHPVTALELAQEICYEAFEAMGRKQIQLVKKALEICPDCVDAYVILAEACSDPKEAGELYAKGVAAGEKLLGKQFFNEEAGHFWGILQTRPYMRARLGLAQTFEETGHLDNAIEHYQEMLRLNPNDNQGVRELLLVCLLETKRIEEAEALLKKYKESRMAMWNYSKALLTFIQKGDSATARKQLKNALKVNPYAAKYLLDDEPLPPLPESYGLGTEEEGINCAAILQSAWESTPEALDWMEEQMD
ncbi:MAG: tetratricopeptide repeat protein [Phycisphaerae bacterium]|jgi:tetratricopeptide (TPR) repeat protein